jgi:hypothetical protein
MFSIKLETLKQLRTAYKTDSQFKVLFAASFFIIEIERCVITYLEVIKTAEQGKGQRLGATFIDNMKELIGSLLSEPKGYSGAFFFVG